MKQVTNMLYTDQSLSMFNIKHHSLPPSEQVTVSNKTTYLKDI